jgi:triacylglycerol esterase/lipase EstA (alpha/beta hydrolase family)
MRPIVDHIMRRDLALTITAVALSCFGLSACASEQPDPPAGARHIRIGTTDGAELDAIELGESEHVAVLSHGATGTKEDFYGLATTFANRGWRVIAYDARGVGDSTGSGVDRQTDLRAIVGYARDTGAEAIVLVGGSLGGSLSIAMAQELVVDAVVGLSAPASSFGALQAAGELPRTTSVMLAVAEGNEPYATDVRQLADVLGIEPLVVSGDRHGTGMFLDHPDLMDQVVAFANDATVKSATTSAGTG